MPLVLLSTWGVRAAPAGTGGLKGAGLESLPVLGTVVRGVEAGQTEPSTWLVTVANAASVKAAFMFSVVSSPDVLGGTVTFLPLEEDDQGSLKVQMSNVYQIQLRRGREEW